MVTTSLLILSWATAHGAPPTFSGKEVEYLSGGKTMQGYLALPATSDSRAPGVLIIHDWNGIDSYERSRADQLAGMGYIAFCVDVYGKGVRPANTQESAAEAGKYYADSALLNQRTKSGLEFLAKQENCNGMIVASGYCFGGKAALEMARAGMNLTGVASFHGSLSTKAPLKRGAYRGDILVMHGADDPFVPAKEVEAFKSEMAAANAKMTFLAYPGAVHSFTVPSADGSMAGAKYDGEADAQSWKDFSAFLKRTVG